MSIPPTDSAYRKDIDGLRAVAVLPVVFGHVGLPGFSGGFVGVDIFFVISGFLITSILHREIGRGAFSVIGFYERRARRILPALFAVLLATLLGGLVALPPDMLADLGGSMLATLVFGSNFWFWKVAQDYFAPASEIEPLLHTWSLAVEEQFYIFFPLLLWALARHGRRSLILAIGGIALASFAASAWVTTRYPSAGFFLAPWRAWELGAGALLALGVVPAIAGRRAREAAAAAGLAMIAGAVALYSPSTPFPGVAALPPCLGAVLIIWTGSHGDSWVRRLLAKPPLVGVGLVSYSLYLWHWPVLVLARLWSDSLQPGAPLAAAVIAASLALAYLSWRWIERPFRIRGPGGLSRRRIFLASGGGMAALGLAAGATVLGDGIPARLPPELAQLYRAAVTMDPLTDDCLEREPDAGFCEFGADPGTGARTAVLVWGDSHAAAALPGFDVWLAGRNRHGIGAVKSACPPLLGVVRADKDADHGCDRFNQAVVDFVAAREDVGLVVLLARWALAAEGSRAPGEAGRTVVLGWSAAAAGHGPAEGNAEILAAALAQTVRALRGLGRDVVIVGGMPEIGWSVPNAVVHDHFFGARPHPGPSRAAYDARNRRANDAIRRIAAEQHLAVADPTRILCPDTCRVTLDGIPLYRDDDHLSVYGARIVIPQLMDQVAPR